ncbi:DUF1846 domain-containing protein [Victivallis sp. Marseille-Q1083]|uniref:DUF1846 domain-containing protein n=1 Tax=Victivallis sp. Marseille-Q1083 TaxID=2717288 RepID=UPI0015892A12|nr:DUF1846 domain-containing protein [Victivallis sp. Marseille-Q1083]
MMKSIGFDNAKYLAEQSAAILERAAKFDNKLYLEFGGKLAYDYHAARILPGFAPNVKIQLLQMLKDKIDIVICIYAGDIERKKIRADFGIAYDLDTLRLIDNLRDWGLPVKAVVVTRYEDQPMVRNFINKLARRQITTYTHRSIKGYPTDIDTIVSDDGYGANSYIESDKPIVIVTGPGGGSGKMATCLSQVYHEYKRGVAAGYAKFETFPVWNLPLDHPVNLAYEAATADIADINMVDPFHLAAYQQTAINYNRDIEIFPVVKRICAKIMNKEQLYQSPTDMGVNRVGFAITDDAVVREAAIQEVIRRYFRYQCEYVMGVADQQTVDRVKLLMDDLGVSETDRPTVLNARETAKAAASTPGKGNDGFYCGAALQLPDQTVIAGKNSPLLHAAASCILNTIKHLAGLPDELLLLSPEVIDSVGSLKKEILRSKRLSLDLDETLIALSVSVPSNPAANLAMKQLKRLAGCEMHLSHLPTPGDEAGLRKLGINLTSDPVFAGRDLFVD